jgi:DNA-binding transcriptional MerR regulator
MSADGWLCLVAPGAWRALRSVHVQIRHTPLNRFKVIRGKPWSFPRGLTLPLCQTLDWTRMQTSSGKLLTIGQFSTLCLLSVRTLRHYDALGLLTPAFVDRVSGYRYYSATQTIEARRIRLYRSWDLRLSEIGELLNQRDTEAVFSVIKRHRSRVEKRIADYQTAIAAIDRELRSDNQKIAVKVSPVQPIVSVGIGNPGVQVDSTIHAIASLSKFVRKSKAPVNGHPFAICHDAGDKSHQAWEICLPVEGRIETAGEIVAKEVGSNLDRLHHASWQPRRTGFHVQETC